MGLSFLYPVVAPFTGAWIEISEIIVKQKVGQVAPFTGAWIEIVCCLLMHWSMDGRTLHGCVD